MNLEEIQSIATASYESGDYAPLEKAYCAAIPSADPDEVWAMLTVHGVDAVHGDGELPTVVVAAIIARALELQDAQMLGTAVRMSHFHCASLVAGDIRKEFGQRALSEAQASLRSAYAGADSRFRVTTIHGLAVAEVASDEDRARLEGLLKDDDPDVLALALMVHAAIGGGERDDVLHEHLAHASPLVRMMAAVSLARQGGMRPLPAPVVEALREAYQNPPALPAWWVFQWLDGPETSQDLTERMLEEAGSTVEPE